MPFRSGAGSPPPPPTTRPQAPSRAGPGGPGCWRHMPPGAGTEAGVNDAGKSSWGGGGEKGSGRGQQKGFDHYQSRLTPPRSRGWSGIWGQKSGGIGIWMKVRQLGGLEDNLGWLGTLETPWGYDGRCNVTTPSTTHAQRQGCGGRAGGSPGSPSPLGSGGAPAGARGAATALAGTRRVSGAAGPGGPGCSVGRRGRDGDPSEPSVPPTTGEDRARARFATGSVRQR